MRSVLDIFKMGMGSSSHTMGAMNAACYRNFKVALLPKAAPWACSLVLGLASWAQAWAAVPPGAALAQRDGPYLLRNADGAWEAWSVEATEEGVRKVIQLVAPSGTITVPAVNDVPAFKVELRKGADVGAEVVRTAAGGPIFVVADTHGEYEIVVEMLQRHRIIGGALEWSFGRGHLVFLGDVFDRGPNQTEILWLIYQLEAEAKRAGGGVHLVIGNHEAMVLRGDSRYLNPKYARTTDTLEVNTYAELFAPRTLLGQWLRTKPAVLAIDDLLCLHGGISRALVERGFTLAEINETVRSVLTGAHPEGEAQRNRAEFVMQELGPLWYRGYFRDQRSFPTATLEDIDRIREHFSVRTILVGHTTVPTITPLYDGKVIAVQVYPRRDEQTQRPVMEALRIEKGRFLRARVDGGVEPLDASVRSVPR